MVTLAERQQPNRDNFGTILLLHVLTSQRPGYVW
jgi:hypothetical protein